MAYQKPNDIDGFVMLMAKADMRVKAFLAEDLVIYLADPENSIVSNDLGLLVDNLMPWLTGSHYKIAQKALEAFTELIGRLGQDFSAYTPTVFPHVVDRLGDSRDTVRQKAQLLLHKLMEHNVLAPQVLLDKLTYCFKNKNAKIREEYLQTIVNTLNEYGTQNLSLKLYIQPIVVLLGDPTSTVRDAAIQTLVEIYKNVGDRLRADLRKKDIQPSKMALLEQKFDEVKRDGLLMPSAHSIDEPDIPQTIVKQTRLVKRTPSSSIRKPLTLDVPTPGDAGAVTWSVFEASFEDVPALTIFNPRDIEDQLKAVNSIIGNKLMDWEKRVDALKKIRSLLLIDETIFIHYTKELSIAFLDILKELRSQVIREACISIAFMSKVLKNKVDTFFTYILQELINLVPNSVKVIASSGTIALKFVVKYSHLPKLIPILTQNITQSKSKDIRSVLSEILGTVFEDWSTRSMEKFAGSIKEALQKGICDADNDARRYNRRNFWEFRQHFPDLADQIYNNCEPAVRKALDRERDTGTATNGTGSMSASLRGSCTSLNSMPGSVIKRRLSSGLRSPATANPSASTSIENLSAATKLQRAPSLPRSYNRNRSGIPVANREPPPRAGFRSISAVDTAAAQRARARAQYSNLARLKVTSGTASLQGHVAQQARSKKIIGATATPPQNQASPEHRVTTRRSSGVSQSQPASRSTSPSSRPYGSYSAYKPTGTIPKKSSGIPRSLASSREASPTRSQGPIKRSGYGVTSSPRRTERPPINPTGRPVLAQKILQQSREAENALADALSPSDFDTTASDLSRLHLNRKISRDESDDSEASSVCSERSFDSYRRNDTGSWNGSRNKLDSCRPLIEDIESIIYYCSSTHWAERKDGLTSLTQYLSEGNELTPQQLQSVLDLFRKMFMDSHTKVYALFLDTVNELIISHSRYLHDWLFILLTRLFNKLGTELLGSMHGKIWKTLRLVHEFFPSELQMHCVFRILCDVAQSPSTKTKIAQLKFLTEMAKTYARESEFSDKPPAERALIKIVTLAMDQKSCELQGLAKQCLIALFNSYTSKMTILLTNLPKQQQNYAKTVIQQSGNNSPSLSCSSPKQLLSPQQGPFSLQNHSSQQRSRQSSVENNGAGCDQPMNTEEVYRSLRKTTAEIQNYSFETKLDRDTNSKDSGISQMGDHQIEQHFIGVPPQLSTNGHNGHYGGFGNFGGSAEKEDSCNGSKTQSTATTESNTPENTIRLDAIDGGNNKSKRIISQKRVDNYTIAENGELITENGNRETDIVKSALLIDESTPAEVIKSVFMDFELCIKYGNCELAIKNFRGIMKIILFLLDSKKMEVVNVALLIIARIFCSQKMTQSWTGFLELIVLKIIDCYKLKKVKTEIPLAVDRILPLIAPVLPFDLTINILNPVIATGEFPTNLCAILLLQELVTHQGATEMTENHLDLVMTTLCGQTENADSSVRKAVVLCIVRMYIVLGEERVKPKFALLLNSSKIRLINVYIKKSL